MILILFHRLLSIEPVSSLTTRIRETQSFECVLKYMLS